MRYTVFDFAGTGGVALAMFNTDAVCTFYLLLLIRCEKCYFDKIYCLHKCCLHVVAW